MRFHAAQVITGHGCFGDYLCHIGRERTARCHQCGGDVDSAQQCRNFDEERRVLVSKIGGDMTLPAVMRKVMGHKDRWEAFVSLCGKIKSPKEANERVRRGEVVEIPTQRRRQGVGPPSHRVARRARGGKGRLAHLRD